MNDQPLTCIKSFFKWDALAIVITVIFDALLIWILVDAFINFIILFEIITLCVLLTCAIFLPIRLIVTKETIRIIRPVGTVKIEMKDILSCNVIEDEKRFFDQVIRTCGSGGVYGYWGYFRHKKYGKIRFFATHRKQCFLIRLKDGKYYAISSEKRDEIVGFIRENTNCLK